MSVLIVGGDHLGNIPAMLKNIGATRIKHVTGRNKRHSSFEISCQTDIVLVLIDYVNHDLALRIKEQAKLRGVKVLFSRRAWSDISQKFQTT